MNLDFVVTDEGWPVLRDADTGQSLCDFSALKRGDRDVRMLSDETVKVTAIRRKATEPWELRAGGDMLEVWVEFHTSVTPHPRCAVYVELQLVGKRSPKWKLGQVLRQQATAGLAPPPIPAERYVIGTPKTDLLHPDRRGGQVEE